MLAKRNVLKRPLLTEKIAFLQDINNQYGFVVDRGANKIEIKRAVEQKYQVTVKSVRTMRVRGKVKTLGRFSGKRADWKKAIVTLIPEDHIEMAENV
jgi:large subunit ribosomal protein L23